MQQSPLFARAYDLAKETLKVVEAFPRHRRAVLGRQLEESVFTLHASVSEAARAARKGGAGPAAARTALSEADGALAAHAFALRLAVDSQLLTVGRYGDVSRLAVECGKLVGGFARSLPTGDPATRAGRGPGGLLEQQQREQPPGSEP